MLAISIKQPWADAMVRGQKTVEVRTWAPGGKEGMLIAIHAGLREARDAPKIVWEKVGWPGDLRRGGVVGVGRLIEVFRYSRRQFEAEYYQHLNPLRWWHKGLWGWRFADLRRCRRIACPGQLGLFALAGEVAPEVEQAIAGGEPSTCAG